MDIEILGYLAGTLTTISFFPQILKILRNKKSDEISISMYAVITTGMFLWIIYGIFVLAPPIIIANSISCAATIIIMILSVIYSRGEIDDRNKKAS